MYLQENTEIRLHFQFSKRVRFTKRWVVLLFLFFYPFLIYSQDLQPIELPDHPLPEELKHLESMVDSIQINIDLRNLPPTALDTIEVLNFRDLDLRDLLRAIGREYNINLLVDNQISQTATIRLAEISVIETLIFLAQEYSLSIQHSGPIFRIHSYREEVPQPEPSIPDIHVDVDNRINMDLDGDPLSDVVRKITRISGRNVVIRSGVSGTLSGYIQNVDFITGLETMLNNNGFSVRETDGIYVVDRMGLRYSEGEDRPTGAFWVDVRDERISLEVDNIPITDIIREISYQLDLNLITYSLPDGAITAKITNLTLEEILSYLFRGTNYTFRREGDVYILGDKNISGIAATKLVRLNHIRADVVIEIIPEKILQGATVDIIKEQNGLLIIGTNDLIVELESFIREIDFPTPQIMIEALVIDVNTSDIFELGATIAGSQRPDSAFGISSLLFGGAADGGPHSGGLRVGGDGSTINNIFATGGNLFGIKNLGVLPDDFYFRVQALSQEGLVNIQSRPQISTLNGHTASIEIGTTQYYILRSTTPLRSQQDVITQETERFETIEANVSLEITPWVSANGEVTAEIKPEFNTPVGTLSSEIPPTINRRVLDSTVRLNDGETIILGGLIQDSESISLNKIPLLGDIPLIGRLFSNRRTSTSKSELIIFITPHVFYGDGTDAIRWQMLRDELENR
ncbi:general secretion pathway protein GspD [soil metagenome]